MLEAEGKLILYLPHLCLYLQLSFSLGVIVLQLAGFGTGEVVCWGSKGSAGCGGDVETSWGFALFQTLRAFLSI